MGIFGRIDAHAWQDVHAETIVQRILDSRARFEERQRIKGVKAVGEEEIRGREGEGGKEENGHAG
jgi:ethanolamine-phosphate cytidylyltransferase